MSPSQIGQPHLWLLPLAAEANPWLSSQEQQWCDQLPEGQQARYAASRSLLRRQLAALLQMPSQAVPMRCPPGEAPHLAEGLGFVSLSHSRARLLLAWSPWPIGVDLEWLGRPLQAEPLARRFFAPQEWKSVEAMPAEARRRAVLELWVRKEAAIKWSRSNLAQDLRHWLWNAERGELIHTQRGWRPGCACWLHDDWFCGVVGEAVEQGVWAPV